MYPVCLWNDVLNVQIEHGNRESCYIQKWCLPKERKKQRREHQRVNAVQINEIKWFKHSVNKPCAMRICLFANIWTGYEFKTMQTVRSFFCVWRTKDKVRVGLRTGTKKRPATGNTLYKKELNHYILNIKQMPSFSTCISADSLVLP